NVVGRLDRESAIFKPDEAEFLRLFRFGAEAIAQRSRAEQVRTGSHLALIVDNYAQTSEIAVLKGAKIVAVAVPDLTVARCPVRFGGVSEGQCVRREGAIDGPRCEQRRTPPHPTRYRDQAEPDGWNKADWLLMRVRTVNKDVKMFRKITDQLGTWLLRGNIYVPKPRRLRQEVAEQTEWPLRPHCSPHPLGIGVWW